MYPSSSKKNKQMKVMYDGVLNEYGLTQEWKLVKMHMVGLE
jgi:hypothetical protein